jgi:hypothetical protein
MCLYVSHPFGLLPSASLTYGPVQFLGSIIGRHRYSRRQTTCVDLFVTDKREDRGTGMGIDIFGWIELQDKVEWGWRAAIKVNAIMGRSYEAFYHVFGTQWKDSSPPPLAAGRGIPSDASRNAHASEDGSFGHSWLLWSEVEGTPLADGIGPEGEQLGGDWRLLCELMACLGRHYGGEHVRLIVWFI